MKNNLYLLSFDVNFNISIFIRFQGGPVDGQGFCREGNSRRRHHHQSSPSQTDKLRYSCRGAIGDFNNDAKI